MEKKEVIWGVLKALSRNLDTLSHTERESVKKFAWEVLEFSSSDQAMEEEPGISARQLLTQLGEPVPLTERERQLRAAQEAWSWFADVLPESMRLGKHIVVGRFSPQFIAGERPPYAVWIDGKLAVDPYQIANALKAFANKILESIERFEEYYPGDE